MRLMPELTTTLPAATTANPDSFQRYYEEAGPDYAAWSPNFNMHFGFYRRGINPFNREAMLEQMNREILTRLHLTTDPRSDAAGLIPDRANSVSPARVLDMGCGLGATLRSMARHLPSAHLHGITLVPWQLEQGRHLNQSCPQGDRITLALGDYEHTTFQSASFDAVYALESSCYAHGASKSAFLQEAHRLLRPGGRIVIADGFLGPGKLRGLQQSIYRKLCECWVIDNLGEVAQVAREMERIGFRDIVVEQMQARVTPSVFHVPWVTLKFLLTQVLFGGRTMTRARWNNILAPILLPFVGYPIGPMAYYVLSATRA
jgi:ubiquinone/menaquinone biosynthesis C-methylase UbiE